MRRLQHGFSRRAPLLHELQSRVKTCIDTFDSNFMRMNYVRSASKVDPLLTSQCIPLSGVQLGINILPCYCILDHGNRLPLIFEYYIQESATMEKQRNYVLGIRNSSLLRAEIFTLKQSFRSKNDLILKIVSTPRFNKLFLEMFVKGHHPFSNLSSRSFLPFVMLPIQRRKKVSSGPYH